MNEWTFTEMLIGVALAFLLDQWWPLEWWPRRVKPQPPCEPLVPGVWASKLWDDCQ